MKALETATAPAGMLGAIATGAVALLPKLTCALCWPAYTAALGALGLEFVDYTPLLLPLTASFVALAVAALAWTARRRQSVVPLLLGVGAGALLLLGKFVVESDALTYAAIAGLAVAPFLPIRRRAQAGCAECTLPTTEEASR